MSREERNQGFLYLLTQATAAALESAEVVTKPGERSISSFYFGLVWSIEIRTLLVLRIKVPNHTDTLQESGGTGAGTVYPLGVLPSPLPTGPVLLC